MDFKAIQEFLRFVNKSDLLEVELEQGDFKLRIKRALGAAEAPAVQFTPSFQAAPTVSLPPTAASAPQGGIANGESLPHTAPAAEPTVPAKNQHMITSPMIGTFYASPGPDKDLYVREGDTIQKGQTLCIIEAMKLFNEIESEVQGRIVKILVENATPVEYDQPLFLVELS